MLRELLTIRYWLEKYSGCINTYMINEPDYSEDITNVLLGHRIYSSQYMVGKKPENIRTFYLPHEIINFVELSPDIDDLLTPKESIEELKKLLGAVRSFITLKEKEDKTLTRDKYGRLDVWFWLENGELNISPERTILDQHLD